MVQYSLLKLWVFNFYTTFHRVEYVNKYEFNIIFEFISPLFPETIVTFSWFWLGKSSLRLQHRKEVGPKSASWEEPRGRLLFRSFIHDWQQGVHDPINTPSCNKCPPYMQSPALPMFGHHPAIMIVNNVKYYQLIKTFILNNIWDGRICDWEVFERYLWTWESNQMFFNRTIESIWIRKCACNIVFLPLFVVWANHILM